MFCKKCGKEIEDNSVFCNYCGYSQISEIKTENKSETTSNISNLLIRAKQYIEQGNPTEGIKYYNRVLDMDPYNIEAKKGIDLYDIKEPNVFIERPAHFTGAIRNLYILKVYDAKEHEKLGFMTNGDKTSLNFPLGIHNLQFILAECYSDIISFEIKDKNTKVKIIAGPSFSGKPKIQVEYI